MYQIPDKQASRIEALERENQLLVEETRRLDYLKVLERENQLLVEETRRLDYLKELEQLMQQTIQDLQREVMDLRENPRDEYHTMEELYQQRMLWHAMAVRGDSQTCKSLRHQDGELCFGGEYFIVITQLPTGQVSQHYKLADWHLFHVRELKTAPNWDGHTSADVIARLDLWLRS